LKHTSTLALTSNAVQSSDVDGIANNPDQAAE